jgi:hypothetical protein
MNMPGFTAEASLDKTTVKYHSRTAHQGRWTGNMGYSKQSIVPQAPRTSAATCDALVYWCGAVGGYYCILWMNNC